MLRGGGEGVREVIRGIEACVLAVCGRSGNMRLRVCVVEVDC